jgi:hypothetical protein
MSNFVGLLGKIVKVLGKITDVLIKGREFGLWSEKGGAKVEKPHDPAGPDLKGFR